MADDHPPVPPEGQLLTYQDGALHVQVRIDGETVWLSQRLLADLHQVTVPTVNEHLVNICRERELAPAATIRKFRIVQTEGSRQVSRCFAGQTCPAHMSTAWARPQGYVHFAAGNGHEEHWGPIAGRCGMDVSATNIVH
jgi:hypothetical protein